MTLKEQLEKKLEEIGRCDKATKIIDYENEAVKRAIETFEKGKIMAKIQCNSDKDKAQFKDIDHMADIRIEHV